MYSLMLHHPRYPGTVDSTQVFNPFKAGLPDRLITLMCDI
jgi:hypothetical protein